MTVPSQRREGAHARSVTEVLDSASETIAATGRTTAAAAPTGFTPLDLHLTGGLRRGDLVVVAGAQGSGKTTFTLQMARNVVAGGGSAIYACYEHDDEALLERLLVLEAGLAAGADAPTLAQVRRRLSSGRNAPDLLSAVADLPGMAAAVAALRSYGQRLQLLRARSDATSVRHLADAVRTSDDHPVLFVDYLQKVASDVRDEEARVSGLACGLKDLALDLEVPVVAIAAMATPATDVRRLRAAHLKGSVTLAYEADAILVLNDKHEIVARDHLMFGSGNLERFKPQVVCTIEKNRAGESGVDMEFRKQLAHSRFDPRGQLVAEQLVDGRIHTE